MKPLVIELTKGKKLECQSLGWIAAKENCCRQQFYALNADGNPLVVTVQAAKPRFYVPGSAAVFSCEPFPDAVCIEVSPCRLLAPPCFQSREEFESQLLGLCAVDPWRALYWEIHNQVLLLTPADDTPLRKRLIGWLATMGRAYETEASNWRKEIKRLETKSLTELNFASESIRAVRVAEAKAQFEIIESVNPIHGVPCKGRLNLTLDGVKRGHEGIRDAWMHEDWANKNGENLGTMAHERRVFRRWLETHTGTPATVCDFKTQQVRQEISPRQFRGKFEDNPQFLEACAKVRFRARFADNANSVVYLADCELREELTVGERDEVANLTTIPKLHETPSWHSESFVTIRRCNGKGKLVENLPLSNEFRALCQLLSERPDQIAQYSEIEPQIGTRTRELDIAAKVFKPAEKGERRVRDLLRTETGRRLLEWGVLTEQEVGREKFLKLNPPNPVQ